MALDLRYNLEQITTNIPPHVKLVAVSKFHPASALKEVYDAGQRLFGENRVQELSIKEQSLPQDIEWHMIGHLQTNKIKVIVPYVHTIESIDSWRLLTEVNKCACQVNRKINCLLEMHIAKEDSKYGFSFDECRRMLKEQEWQELANISIAGVMGMATYTEDEALVRSEFGSLKNFFTELKDVFFMDRPEFCEISMGMSHDYKIAIEEGSTIIRVGTSIFGEREY